MQEMMAGGTTTILVSHSLSQIRALCSKILWLDKGRQVEFGEDVEGICDRYQAFLGQKKEIKRGKAQKPGPGASHEGGIRPGFFCLFCGQSVRFQRSL